MIVRLARRLARIFDSLSYAKPPQWWWSVNFTIAQFFWEFIEKKECDCGSTTSDDLGVVHYDTCQSLTGL